MISLSCIPSKSNCFKVFFFFFLLALVYSPSIDGFKIWFPCPDLSVYRAQRKKLYWLHCTPAIAWDQRPKGFSIIMIKCGSSFSAKSLLKIYFLSAFPRGWIFLRSLICYLLCQIKSWKSENSEKEFSSKLVQQDYSILGEVELFQIN